METMKKKGTRWILIAVDGPGIGYMGRAEDGTPMFSSISGVPMFGSLEIMRDEQRKLKALGIRTRLHNVSDDWKPQPPIL